MLRLKLSLIVLLLPALLCRAMIPAGFMPGTGEHFSVTLKICPGHQGHETGGGAPRPHAPNQDHPCVFGSGGASAPAATVLAAIVPVAVFNLPVSVLSPSPAGRILARAHLARGPPQLI